MKWVQRVLAFSLALCLMAACVPGLAASKPTTSLTVNKETIELKAGTKARFKVTRGAIGEEDPVSYMVQNEAVATCAKVAGLANTFEVTAVAVGETLIRLISGDLSATVKVTVLPVADAIVVEPGEATIERGQKVKLEAKVMPEGATLAKIVWSSSKPKIATVGKKGMVTGKKVGKAIIRAKSGNGKIVGLCTVTVVKKGTLPVDPVPEEPTEPTTPTEPTNPVEPVKTAPLATQIEWVDPANQTKAIDWVYQAEEA